METFLGNLQVMAFSIEEKKTFTYLVTLDGILRVLTTFIQEKD